MEKNKDIIILVFVFAALFVVALSFIFLSDETNDQSSILNQDKAMDQPPLPSAFTAIPLAEENIGQQKIEIWSASDGGSVRGNPNASVVIVEFCDFQYLKCAKAYKEIIKVLEAYTGKVKFVYIDFPLNDVHIFAQDAAEASKCAEEQGRYWEYHDRLFESQQEWKEKGGLYLKKYAEELMLDVEKFNSCFDSRKYNKAVQEDMNDGKNLGITSIPFFFINNRTLVGALKFEDLQKVIEAELNKLKEKQKYGEIEFYSFEKGIEEARRYDKTVLIYFRSDSCYWCMKFDEEVLTNKSVVQKIKMDFIPAAVDMDSEKRIPAKFNVFMTPSIVFTDSSGNELKKLIGFREAGTFLEELNGVPE